ncbi:glycosyltransferase family 4 protein [Desulfovulcanus sp.]
MKVAIAHYWLVGMRGGEKVVEAFCNLFPDADIFTHVYDPASISDTIKKHRICTTFIQKLPRAIRYYQCYLPLMPLALEQLDLRGYDLVISSESGPAKGVVVGPETLHVCYCHTPMRYVWDMYHDYREGAGRLKRLFMSPLIHYLRMWDLASASRVDHFIANSAYVARRIEKHYRREAKVIPPPVDTQSFTPSSDRGDFYLMVGQLVRYKRPDLAVEAFNKMGKKLVVIGDGEMMADIKSKAEPNIHIMGWQPFSVIRDCYARCRALIFPGQEDFGIVPVEAMASGRPVIAYKRGGVLDSLIDGVTGVFFEHQTAEALIDAVERYERRENDFDPKVISEHAKQFDRDKFLERMQNLIAKWM